MVIACGICVSELSAYRLCLSSSKPTSATDGPPLSIAVHLHSPLRGIPSSHQPNPQLIWYVRKTRRVCKRYIAHWPSSCVKWASFCIINVQLPHKFCCTDIQKVMNKLLTAGNCHIISMAAGSTDGCAVLTGEEMEEIGGVAAHIVQENCTITLTKSGKKTIVSYEMT